MKRYEKPQILLVLGLFLLGLICELQSGGPGQALRFLGQALHAQLLCEGSRSLTGPYSVAEDGALKMTGFANKS